MFVATGTLSLAPVYDSLMAQSAAEILVTPEGQQTIRGLIDHCRIVLDSHEVRHFNEARTVNELILPLFGALGWDIHNRHGEGEVLPEQPAATGRADWTLSIRKVPRLLVEAKRLGIALTPEHARQAIAYSYSRGVTWAVLSNFQETRVYNAEWALKDPELSRFLTLRWDHLDVDLDRLGLLTRRGVDEGLLDQEAEKYGRKRVRTPVGEQLFADLVRFRVDLRKVFFAYNRDVAAAHIDGSVQRLLDRLIFMLAAEDRQIEPAHLRGLVHRLEASGKRDLIWERLLSLFREFEADYDSQLFELQLLDRLDTEWKPIWDTVHGLCESEDSLIQYDFRGIDADVLGGVYEQYLGHIARTDGERANSKKSPAASAKSTPFRKAHGVYYTPKWMVRYIVDGSLGHLLRETEPSHVQDVRVLDPACGSGSFLVEAFRVLTDYWERVFKPQDADEVLELRTRILRESIYGIDLDPQAVEIAQLNLLLVALNQKARLPDLSMNIVVGNALLDPRTRPVPVGNSVGGWLSAVDVSRMFPRVEASGFDVLVMNPPYYDLQLHPFQQDVLRHVYPEVASGHDDALYYFLARAVDLVRDGGEMGCVVARYWLDSLFSGRLREHLLGAMTVRELFDFRSFQPFGKDVGVNAAIMLARKGSEAGTLTRFLRPAQDGVGPVPQEVLNAVIGLDAGTSPAVRTTSVALDSGPWRSRSSRGTARRVLLGDIALMTQGIKTGLNEIYVMSTKQSQDLGIERELLRPVLEGRDIGAFAIVDNGCRLLYLDGSRDLEAYPAARAYLEGHKETLSSRAEARRGAYPWWRIQRPRRSPVLEAPIRIIAPSRATRPRFAAIAPGPLRGAVGLTDTLMLSLVDDRFDPYMVLAVLNSRYGDQWTRENTKGMAAGKREFFATGISLFPLPVCDPDLAGVLAEYGRGLQVIVPPSRVRRPRFDDKLNAAPPRSTLLAELDELVERALGI